MMSLPGDSQANVIEAFNFSSRYRIRGNFRRFKFLRFWVKNMHIDFRGL